MGTSMNQNGCSVCLPGEERHENFYSHVLEGYRVQYDYRTPAGQLFSCISLTLEEARLRRDAWLIDLERRKYYKTKGDLE